MNLWNQDGYTSAWNFASDAHKGQKLPGLAQRPYVTHVGNVAMEVMAAIAQRGDVARPDVAVQCALLHDVVEDSDVTVADIAARFGTAVAEGVSALSKNPALPSKADRMRDSLERIRQQPHEVWMVKLADRITNLQPPPEHWSEEKVRRYRDSAREIHKTLSEACPILGPRLLAKIATYG